jgi:hypothetical protein
MLSSHENTRIYVEYFYPDGIVKYDGSSTPQIDGTISKGTLFFFAKIYHLSIS